MTKSRTTLFDFTKKNRAYNALREKSDATISRKNWMEKARANSKSYTLLMNAIF